MQYVLLCNALHRAGHTESEKALVTTYYLLFRRAAHSSSIGRFSCRNSS